MVYGFFQYNVENPHMEVPVTKYDAPFARLHVCIFATICACVRYSLYAQDTLYFVYTAYTAIPDIPESQLDHVLND
jgi:hypothetical protein